MSKYSPDLGTNIEKVVLVDGVFFSVKKSRLKETFDESVEGFHFYDVDFCFRNTLAGGSIGVHTNIVVNHQSIGMTNDAWEENRKQFIEKFKDNLPLNIPEDFKNRKMKVLISCLNFNGLTGSELHVYELAKGLVNKNCDVTICSNIGEPLANMAKKHGIKLTNIQEPPGFKLGDGKWGMNTPNGQMMSEVGKLYQISDVDFDIIHVMHKPITEYMLKLYPNINMISTIHSEVIELEHPIIHNNIKKYIAIRPEIKKFLIKDFSISDDDIEVIYNPIDETRFNENYSKKDNKIKIVLFVGTMDYLRKNAIIDLITDTKNSGKKLWLVGKDNGIDIKGIISDEEHVTYFGEQNNVEKYVKDCDETAGILLGRTTIEGWLCGKPAIIYDVDENGVIQSKEIKEVPTNLEMFKTKNVISKTIKQYYSVINHVEKKVVDGVSILVPAYNNVKYIEECLTSISEQDYFNNNDNYEILIGIDGCEKTLEKVKEIKGDYKNIKVIYMKTNMGVYVTSNTLVSESKYDNLIMFGSDDIMRINMVSTLMKYSPKSDIIRFKFSTFINDDIDSIVPSQSNHMHAFGAIFIKKSVFDLCGGYEDLRFSGDLELLTRVGKFTNIKLIDDNLFLYRSHPKNLTHTIPLSERAKVDNVIRSKDYQLDNIKIKCKTNTYIEID